MRYFTWKLELDLWMIVGTKIQLKQAILNSGTKFAQRGYFQWKTEKVNICFILYIWINLGTIFQA